MSLSSLYPIKGSKRKVKYSLTWRDRLAGAKVWLIWFWKKKILRVAVPWWVRRWTKFELEELSEETRQTLIKLEISKRQKN